MSFGVDTSESEGEQSSKTFQFDFTDLEDLLAGVNLDVVQQQIASITEVFGFQRVGAGAAAQGIGAISRDERLAAELFTDEERSAQLQEDFDRQQRSGQAFDELLQTELDRIRQGPGATPEQLDLINQSTEAQIRRGESDILEFGQRAVNLISEELAPSRGLRPSDTPIQDRAFRIGGELQRQQGQLVSGLRGAQAQAELNFPLAAGQQQAALSQFQQGLLQSGSQFQAQLAQQAQANRLNLFGQAGQLGLGLVGQTQPFPGLQQSFKPQLGQESSGTQSSSSFGLSASK